MHRGEQQRAGGGESIGAEFICRNVHVELDMSIPTYPVRACPSATPSSACSPSQPSTGYELTQCFDKSLANAWHASHSQIYPELAKLEDEGMVEVVGEGARRSRTWAVTDAGRDGAAALADRDRARPQPSATRPRVRWFLVACSSPTTGARCSSASSPSPRRDSSISTAIAAAIDALGRPQPFRADRRPRPAHHRVMRDWLQEQLSRA